jgi:hypothetical protein
VSKRQDNREFLQSIPPADVKYILNGYLASEASQADADTYIRVYELHCLENKSLADIAKSFDCTVSNIERKIQKIIDLIKRNPIVMDKLPPDTDIYQIPLQSLFLSARTYQCLKSADIVTVGDIVRRGGNDLLRIRNFGRKSLNEIKTVLWNLMSRFHPKPWLQEDIEKLKTRSDELSTKSAEWSRDDHARLVGVLGELESKLSETKSLIEQVLKSGTRRGHHVMEGFVVPYAVWERLWSWSDSERNPEKTILDIMNNANKS